MQREIPLRIDSQDGKGAPCTLLGMLHLPCERDGATLTAVLIVSGGAQYRTGSHRQFVQPARALSLAGHPVLRFDMPGLGDSLGEPLSFEASAPVIGDAIDALYRQVPQIDRVVLWGLCDGASACLLYVQARHDPRVAGLALLNPWVRNEASMARAQVKHYYKRRVLQASFWRKLARGQVGWQAVQDLGRQLHQLGCSVRTRQRPPSNDRFQDRMAMAWQTFPGSVLLLLSEHDLTAQEFVEHAQTDARWLGWKRRERLTRHRLDQADHTCSEPASARQLQARLMDWLQQLP
jgi:exosortase A-associated hydrolase 1